MASGVVFTPTGNSPLRKIVGNGVDFNGTGDRFTFNNLPSTPYVVESLLIHNWSATPSASLSLTLRDAATGAGNTLVGTLSTLNVLISNTALAAEAVPNASVIGTKRRLSSSNLYLNASAGNGTALTADVTLIIKLL